MSYGIDSMQVTVKKAEALTIVRGNREAHAAIVAEAREGYLDKARKALSDKMEKLLKGKVVALSFHLSVPRDHTKEYDTAIKMLEMHTGDTVGLTAGQVRTLIQDEWDWKDRFYATNSAYSGTARAAQGEDW